MIDRVMPTRGRFAASPRRLAAALGVCCAALVLNACDPSSGEGLATPSGTAVAAVTPSVAAPPSREASPASTPGTPEGTPPPETSTASATAEPGPSADERLRTHLLSSLTTDLDPGSVRTALDAIEVVSLQLEDPERDLWVAATSGHGIWELSENRLHVAAIYELGGDGTWVEVAQLALESAPTVVEPEIVLIDHAGADWIAIHGFTGAHSGTFELLRFDGLVLESVMWSFSPSPGAATIADLDGNGLPDIVLDATDPYVYCYACGVRAWSEVIYRWDGDELVGVPIQGVAHERQIVVDLTEQAAAFASADLWANAQLAVRLARAEAPGDEEVRWLEIAISRIAEARLADAGAEAQPLMTSVLAGEYDMAVGLMRAYPPAEALSPTGPLIAGTVAEGGWEYDTGERLIDYASRAIGVNASLAPAYAVRAFGRLLLDADDWAGALEDMAIAFELAPDDPFYEAAVEYLLDQNGGAFG